VVKTVRVIARIVRVVVRIVVKVVVLVGVFVWTRRITSPDAERGLRVGTASFVVVSSERLSSSQSPQRSSRARIS
jgi:hypothetical protein